MFHLTSPSVWAYEGIKCVKNVLGGGKQNECLESLVPFVLKLFFEVEMRQARKKGKIRRVE